MNRRAILKSISWGLFGLLSRSSNAAVQQSEIPVNYFDWTADPPQTSDSRFAPLGRDEGNAPEMFINGVRLGWGEYITKCMTGDRGWVEFMWWDEFLHEMDEFIKLHPFVEYDRNGQVKSPSPPEPRRYRVYGMVVAWPGITHANKVPLKSTGPS